MADIVNLRRARKAKARAAKASEADANRAAHGVAKSARTLAKRRAEKEKNALDAHRREIEDGEKQ